MRKRADAATAKCVPGSGFSERVRRGIFYALFKRRQKPHARKLVLKLKTWFAAAALAAVAACSGDSTGSGGVDIGPPAPLPAGVDTVPTASGLKYADITVGTGDVA